MARTLIIGLDGGSLDLVKQWVEQGDLPNLSKLLEGGTHGHLNSTVPPMTPPAWNSFMTGKNPGKHGIFDFTERVANKLELRIVNSSHRKSETIWKRLSRSGKRVGVIGVPGTFPPEAVNGIMISGFDAPGADERAMYPPGLCKELKEKIGGYILTADFLQDASQGRVDEAVEKLLNVIERKAAAAKYLLSREPWDCFMIVFGETDAVVHHFWKYHDKKSPQYNVMGYRTPFTRFIRKLTWSLVKYFR